jgi:hypothetical protein
LAGVLESVGPEEGPEIEMIEMQEFRVALRGAKAMARVGGEELRHQPSP